MNLYEKLMDRIARGERPVESLTLLTTLLTTWPRDTTPLVMARSAP